MRLGSASLAFAVLLVPGLAHAEPQAVDRFEPSALVELLGVQGVDVDTGWVPPASAIQVRFIVHFEDDVEASMAGDAVYDWGENELYFDGDPDGGAFSVDVGAILDAEVRFDILGQQFDSPIIGPYDLAAIAETEFTPYLLEGNADRPAHVERFTRPSLVFEYALVDVLIASGTFFVDAAFEVQVDLECQSIDVSPGATSVTVELEAEPLAPQFEDVDLEVEAQLHCTTTSNVVLLLYPGVELQIGFESFELAPFQLPVPVLTDAVGAFDFDPLPLVFGAPPPMADGSSSGASGESGTSEDAPGGSEVGSGSNGAEESGAGSSTSTSASTGEVVATGTSDTAGGTPERVDGCGCSAHPKDRRTLALTFFLLGILLRRRSKRGPQAPR